MAVEALMFAPLIRYLNLLEKVIARLLTRLPVMTLSEVINSLSRIKATEVFLKSIIKF